MTQEERHRQLLDEALALIRESGVDGLTLITLARRAGVSKPVTYDHFGTRQGLLIEIYREFDESAIAALGAVLACHSASFVELADSIVATLLDCYAKGAGEWQAVAAAMQGNEEMTQIQRLSADRYVDCLCKALGAWSPLDVADLRLTVIGLLSAVAGVASQLSEGQVSRARAHQVLAHMVTAACQLRAPKGAPS